jgi:LysR family glycine cleavage system transcriptional activator
MPREHELSRARRLTPPISALAAFEAVARRGSFTSAAQELALTQSAVSRQISGLEKLLGVALFEGSRRRQVTLTPSGAFYAERIRQMLSNLAAATTEAIALGGLGRALRLGIPPTFGSRWLIPRMPDFFAAHPDIVVEFSTRVPGRINPGLENIDALIDFAQGPGGSAEWHRLMELDLRLVATPRIAQQVAAAATGALRGVQLLVHRTERQALTDVFANASLPALGRQPILTFESYAMLFQAANAELGIGLAPGIFIEGELAGGLLVPVSDLVIHSKNVGYMVFAPEKSAYPPLAAFRAWLFDMANADRSGRGANRRRVPASAVLARQS